MADMKILMAISFSEWVPSFMNIQSVEYILCHLIMHSFFFSETTYNIFYERF
jgi:hypothetical protein